MDYKNESIIKNCVKMIISANEEPLDGDETEAMACLFHIELDHQSGNITEEEYRKRLNLIESL